MQIISQMYFHLRQFYCFAHFLSACFILDLILYFGSLGLVLEDLRKLTRHRTWRSIPLKARQFIAIDGQVMWKHCARRVLKAPLFKVILIYPAISSISIYHPLKVRVTVINPVNCWPRRQDSIYRALFKSSGKLVLPKSEWGNYLNHLRPSISDSCVWCVQRLLTRRCSFFWLVFSICIHFVMLQIIYKDISQCNLYRLYSILQQEAWEVGLNLCRSVSTCANVKVKVVEEKWFSYSEAVTQKHHSDNPQMLVQLWD